MLDKFSEIEFNGKKYKIVFDMNVMETIQEEYNSLDEWQKALLDKENPNFKVIKWSLALLLNEGIEYDNFVNGTDNALLTEKQVGFILSGDGGFVNAIKNINSAVVNYAGSSEKSDEEIEEKNVIATQE